MFRRCLFLGLMLVLVSVLAGMILTARKQEKRVLARPAEIVRDARPSRVIAPPDLEIAASRMERAGGATPAAGVAVSHDLTLRSTAPVAYERLMLQVAYQAADGTTIESRSYLVEQKVPPGATVRLPAIAADPLPRRPARCRVQIAWAELAP